MIDIKRFSLNRIISPSLELGEFYAFASSVGLRKVELRNDIGGKDPVDGLRPAEAARIAADHDIEVITINALQKFNLATARAKASEELQALLELSRAIRCKAVVLCPNNDPADGRDAARRLGETVEALAAFGPSFEDAGILGYVEPLGFGISSLASLVTAQDAIRESGFACYRIVLDTFHHYIGPDDSGILGKAYSVASTGLVHVSGVEASIATGDYRDEHRVLAGPADRMKSKEQIRKLVDSGYEGDISFEPFSPAVQKLSKVELAQAVGKSLEYLRA
jgi:2-keto-myo-inositol isomerase